MGIEGIAAQGGASLADLGPARFDQRLTGDGTGLLEQGGHEAGFDWGERNPPAPEAEDAPLLQLRSCRVAGRALNLGLPGPQAQRFEASLEVGGCGRDPDPVLDGARTDGRGTGFDQQEKGVPGGEQRSTLLPFTRPSDQGNVHQATYLLSCFTDVSPM
jgi:hypothetical protein